MPPTGVHASSIYQLKVTLQGVKPPVWRQLQVQAGITGLFPDLRRAYSIDSAVSSTGRRRWSCGAALECGGPRGSLHGRRALHR